MRRFLSCAAIVALAWSVLAPASTVGARAVTDATATSAGAPAQPAVDTPGVPSAGAGFHPLSPTRVLDSRTATGGWNAKLVAGKPRTLPITGTNGVPATAIAAVVNVTVTNPTAASFLTVFPGGSPAPNASNLNFAANQTVANSAIVRLGPGGALAFANAVGATHVIVDLVGYFDNTPGSGDSYFPMAPTRVLDSRTTTGGWPGPLGSGAANARTVQLISSSGLPVTATAALLNVTATNGDAGSFVQVWPTGLPRPTSSNINVAAGQTAANLVAVPIGTDGNVSIANEVGHLDVVVDIVGYFDPETGTRYHPLAPTRVLDDRTGTGLTGPWGPGQTRDLPIGDALGVPPSASAVVTNLTATNASVGSFATGYPAGTAVPTASSVNFGPNQTIPNLTVTRLGTTAAIALYNELGTVDLVADAQGYFAADRQLTLGGPSAQFGSDPSACAQFEPTTGPPCGPQPMYWAAINGPYDDRRNGDPYATKCGPGTSGTGCTQSNLPPGGTYRTTGYDYAVDVGAQDVGRPLTIQVYDLGDYTRRQGRGTANAPPTRTIPVTTTAGSTTITSAGLFLTAGSGAGDAGQTAWFSNAPGSTMTIVSVTDLTTATLSRTAPSTGTFQLHIGYDCNSNQAPFNQAPYSTQSGSTWTFVSGFSGSSCQTGDDSDGQNMDVQLYDNDDTDARASTDAPLDPCHLGPVDANAFFDQASTFENHWTDVCTFTPTKRGIYPLRVRNSGFGTPADAGSGTNSYSVKLGGGTTSRLYPLRDASTFVNSVGASFSMYLGWVPPSAAGKTLLLDWYDVGDGNQGNYSVQFEGPAGGVPEPNPSGGIPLPAAGLASVCHYNATPSAAEGPATPDTAAACTLQTSSGGMGFYNGNWLRVAISIDPTYTCTTDCYWRVHYSFGAAGFPTDRSAWKLSIL